MEVITLVLIILAVCGLFIYSVTSWGLVLFKFWGWFVLPIFQSLPELTFAQAVGLMLVISLFKGVNSDVIKAEYKEKWGVWLGFAYPWITLLFGWLAYLIFIV
jgi:hypothetical protein